MPLVHSLQHSGLLSPPSPLLYTLPWTLLYSINRRYHSSLNLTGLGSSRFHINIFNYSGPALAPWIVQSIHPTLLKSPTFKNAKTTRRRTERSSRVHHSPGQWVADAQGFVLPCLVSKSLTFPFYFCQPKRGVLPWPHDTSPNRTSICTHTEKGPLTADAHPALRVLYSPSFHGNKFPTYNWNSRKHKKIWQPRAMTRPRISVRMHIDTLFVAEAHSTGCALDS